MILFYLLIVALALPDHPLFAAGVGDWSIVKMIGAACVLFAIAESFMKRRWPNLLSGVPSRFAFIYIAIAALSCITREVKTRSGLAILSKEAAVVILFLSALLLLNSVSRLRRALLVLCGSVALASLFVIRQYQEYHNLYRDFRGWGGVSGDPNYFALAAVLCVPTCVLWVVNKHHSRMERLYCAACLVPICLGFAISGSRGGLLGMGAAMVVLMLRMRRKLIGGVVVAVMLTSVTLPPDSPLRRLIHPTESDKESSDARLLLWRPGLKMFVEHPIVGIGFANIPDELTRQGAPNFVALHNTYVECAAALGIGGLTAFLGLLGAAAYALGKVSRQIRRAGAETLADAAAGLQSGIVGYSACAFFLSTWWYMMVWLVIAISLSVLHLSHKVACRQQVSNRWLPSGRQSNGTKDFYAAPDPSAVHST